MMFIRFTILAFFVLFIGRVSHASSQILEDAYVRLLMGAQTETSKLISRSQVQSCDSQIMAISEDGTVDIVLVLGYMDVSLGQSFNDSGSQMYGPGTVLDLPAKKALVRLLTAPCRWKNSKTCGYKKSGDTLTRRVKGRWGRRLNLRIKLQSSSVSINNSINTGQRARAQQTQSAKVKATFHRGLKQADAVIYMGHARSGGGPDFSPPHLTASGRVNYNYYKQQKQGLKEMLGALNSANDPAPIIGLLSCKSTNLFASSVLNRAPHSTLVSAGALFDYYDILPTGLAMVEAIANQQCGAEFDRVVRVRAASRRFLHIH